MTTQGRRLGEDLAHPPLVLAQEHRLYPQALRMMCQGEVQLVAGRACHTGAWSDAADLAAPPVDGT